ncbi:hypothetical protein AZF01_13475 [Martelella sp. AD-3]|nr:hypothetical protein AZF01_13475 [Martelella sp. AD-3]
MAKINRRGKRSGFRSPGKGGPGDFPLDLLPGEVLIGCIEFPPPAFRRTLPHRPLSQRPTLRGA